MDLRTEVLSEQRTVYQPSVTGVRGGNADAAALNFLMTLKPGFFSSDLLMEHLWWLLVQLLIGE